MLPSLTYYKHTLSTVSEPSWPEGPELSPAAIYTLPARKPAGCALWYPTIRLHLHHSRYEEYTLNEWQK